MKSSKVFFGTFLALSFITHSFAIDITVNEISNEKIKENHETIVLNKPNIPIQISLEDEENYTMYRNKAATYLSEGASNECAKFVNRMFLLRFGKLMFGNAWDLQIINKDLLDFVWSIPEDSFTETLRLKKITDRIKHFQELYAVLDEEKTPVGVLGFVYKYSFYKDYVASLSNRIPQTHITFLAGRKYFYFENESEIPKSLEEILVDKYGVIHDIERAFVDNKVKLDRILQPRDRVYYNDYLVEEQFKKVQGESLLEVFLRKHRNNRVSSLLRPVSYSRVTQSIIKDLEMQEEILTKLGDVEYIPGKEFENHFLYQQDRKAWEKVLSGELGIDFPRKSLLIPVPQNLIGQR